MPDELPVLSVSDLTMLLKGVVEAHFPSVWVSGEISNFMRAGSGHLYFTLKDDEAQLKAVMWRSAAQRLKFQLHDGLEVLASGPIEVYASRGQYQIIVDRMQPQGLGALELALRQLQQKLAAEGLFNEERKRPLPMFPRRIALVTSPTGAAVHDMLQVITRRWPAARVVILPVAVQGDGAAQQIAAAGARCTCCRRWTWSLPGGGAAASKTCGLSMKRSWRGRFSTVRFQWSVPSVTRST